jgi:sodium-dependent dicarboxylate transporter 2/3/5
MWISNTATAIIMLPVALSIIKLIDKDNPHYKDFSTCLLLAIAYSCSIGGMGTLVGTGTNMFYAGYTEEILNQPVSFIQWMGIALPVVIVMLPVSWYLMTHFIFKIPNDADQLPIDTGDIHTMGVWELGQVLTFIIFILAALSWSTLPLLREWTPLQNISDTGIAVGAAFLLFVIPANLKKQEFLLDWETTVKKVPWGILLLIGGGLCMAGAVSENGIGEYISLLLSDSFLLPALVLIFAVLTLMVFLTEISSNIASVTALSPVFTALALSRNMDPSFLIIPITLAASCAFMLPAATMPNSIVMGSGMVRGWQMARAGFLLNIVGIVIITLRVSLL